MIQEQLIRNYAVALFNNAKERDIVEIVFEQIKVIGTILEHNSDIRRSLVSPVISKQSKMQLVRTLTTTLKIDQILYNFLLLLVKNSRMAVLSLIIEFYSKLLCQDNGIQIVYITSAKTLTPQEKEWIQDFIQEKLHKKFQTFQTVYSVDSTIIGGITIKYGSMLIDLSIKSNVAKIGKAMLSSL